MTIWEDFVKQYRIGKRKMKMKYEEVQAEKALELSPHHHAYINPYTGCSMGCPFCFWLSMEGWEGRIGVRKNLPELLRRELKDWPKDEFLYLGSICDPLMKWKSSTVSPKNA